MSLLILTSNDIQRIISEFTTHDLQFLMAKVFHLYSNSRPTQDSHPASATEGSPPKFVMPHRSAISTANYTTLFMPAHATMSNAGIGSQASATQTGIKIVSIPKGGSNDGIPATAVVLDPLTGAARAIVNARMLTALRNAAGSLLSTTLIGPFYPERLVLYGAGQQIQMHIDLFIRHFTSIKECTIINRSANTRAELLIETCKAKFSHVAFTLLVSSKSSVDNQVQKSIEESTRSADIIICATSSTVPLFPSHYVATGTHVILIGSYTPQMHEVDTDLIRRSLPHPPGTPPGRRLTHLLVDSIEACSQEAGEILLAGVPAEDMQEIGRYTHSDQSGGLDLVRYQDSLNLKTSGPRSKATPDDTNGYVTVFKSVGIGLQDVAIASAVVDKALESNVGTQIPQYD